MVTQRSLLHIKKKVYRDLEKYGAYTNEKVKINHLLGAEYLCDVQVSFYDKSKIFIYVVLKNNNDVTALYKNLITELGFFDTIQSITTDLIFRVDLCNNTIKFFGRSLANFELDRNMENFPYCIKNTNVIPIEDEIIFNELAVDMYEGKSGNSIFRLKDKHNKINWYRIDYSNVKNIHGEPIESVGIITNIQEQHELIEKINIDPLTGCYTKYAFEALSKEVLLNQGDLSHAFLIIDVDHFKEINDNLGHRFGDKVLKEIGEKLRKILRNDDCIGRIGGDEFMIYIKNISDVEVIARKVELILQVLFNEYTYNCKSYCISGSVGIAVYPWDGTSFAQLYHNADLALYECKRNGRNGYEFYENVKVKDEQSNTLIFKASNMDS